MLNVAKRANSLHVYKIFNQFFTSVFPQSMVNIIIEINEKLQKDENKQ